MCWQTVCLSVLWHWMTVWVKKRRSAASKSSQMSRPTFSLGWNSPCSIRWGRGGQPAVALQPFQKHSNHMNMFTSRQPCHLWLIVHGGHGAGPVIFLCVCVSVDKLWARGACRGSLGPRDHGGAGAGFQSWGCYPCAWCFSHRLVVGKRGRQRGLVPLQLCQSK